jgi:hypothetical protein
MARFLECGEGNDQGDEGQGFLMADFATEFEDMLDAYSTTKPTISSDWQTLMRQFIGGHEVNGSPTNGQVPTWNSTSSKWDFTTPGGGSDLYYDQQVFQADVSSAGERWYSWQDFNTTNTKPTIINSRYWSAMERDGEIKHTLVSSRLDAGTCRLKFYVNFEATASIDSGNQTMTSDGTGYYLLYTWSGKTFSKRDRLSFSFTAQTGQQPGAISIRHEFEFDKTT